MQMLIALLLSSITARGVINPIAVAAPAGGNSALYLTIRNSNYRPDQLVRVTCDCAERVELLTARGGGLALEGESVALPPDRLVELRPGGSRHFRLLHLRRPLVAGETVAMTFHYSDGAETRNVAVVADAEAGWAAGLARAGSGRLAALAPLAGSCWRGALPDGRRTETRCFSPAYYMFMQDRRVVEGAAAPAETSYTMYFHDVMGMSTTYSNTGPDGPRTAGRVRQEDADLLFEDYAPNPVDSISTRTAWRPDGPDAWIVRGERRGVLGWREQWRLRMVRAGPAPPL